jgi:hypothetical protein
VAAPIKPIPYTGFTGLDLRRHPDASDEKSARVASNVNLTLGGEYQTRGQLQLVAVLDPNSVGLYKAGDQLHAAFPVSNVLSMPISPPGVFYDPIGYSTATGYPAGVIQRVTSASNWGLTGAGRVAPYIVVSRYTSPENQTLKYEHHFIQDIPGGTGTGAFANGFPYLTGSSMNPQIIPVGSTVTRNGDTETYIVTGHSGFDALITPNYAGSSTGTPVAYTYNTPVDTLVNTGFVPGPMIMSFGNKMWATSPMEGTIHFSSTANGPSDWTTVNDAGFLDVLRFIDGSRIVSGFGFYQGQLVVFFADGVQLWAVGSNPAAMNLNQSINGPGTSVYQSIGNIVGDVVYFSQGGFRSMRQDILTGRMVENGMGARIKPLTDIIDLTGVNPVSLWRQATGQYLCAFGNTVYVYGYYPEAQLTGWTTWTLPITVDYMVEVNGLLYIRGTDNNLYLVNEDGLSAGSIVNGGTPWVGEAGFSFEVQTQFLNFGQPAFRKQFTILDVIQFGKSNVKAYFNSANVKKVYSGGVITGSTVTQKITPLAVAGVPSVSIDYTGTAPWLLSGFVIHARTLTRA